MFEFISMSIKMSGKYKRKLLAGILFIFIENFSMLLSFTAIYLSFYWLDNITISKIWVIFGVLMTSFVFHFIFNWIQNAFIAGVFFSIFKDYRLKIGEKLKNSRMGYFTEQSLSKILSCFTNVIKWLENFSQMTFAFTISGLSISFFLLFGLFSMSIKIGFLALFLLLICWLFVFLMFKISKFHVEEEHKATEAFADALVDGIRGISVLRSFPGLKQKKVREIHTKVYQSADDIKNKLVKFEIIFTIYYKVFATILNLSSLIVTLFAAYLFTIKEVTLAQSLTLSAASFMLFDSLKQLKNSAVLLVKNPAQLNYLDEVMDIPEIKNGKLKSMIGKKDIEFENVCFSYTAEKKIIKNINFKINEGSKTAIVGPSGSGKTTIINLIARFYDVNEGCIKIAGNNIQNYEVDSLLRELSLVFQDVYLFNDTVKNNIKFAKANASDDEIIEVAKKAMCYDFIMEMEYGFDTIIGEGGSTISGGEKQRISIARALLKNSPIILLDEATSSVDPENEYEIMKAIDELSKGRTVISIAHRLSTVKKADQILVIDQGKIVQTGKHDQLLKQEGIYKDFINAREKTQNWSFKI